eukprot:gene3147-3936_t
MTKDLDEYDRLSEDEDNDNSNNINSAIISINNRDENNNNNEEDPDTIIDSSSLLSNDQLGSKKIPNGIPLEEIHIDASITTTEANKPKIEDPDETPKLSRATWIRVLVIYSAVLSDGLSLTLIQPFLPNLLHEKWGIAKNDIGYVSGLLVGVYSLARFFSGFYLGHLSDRFGRKWFLVLSLLATGIGTFFFALLPNIGVAMAVRFAEGIFSNTTALAQASLADMTDKRNRPAVFAYLGGTFALSRCLSSAMGGFLVRFGEKMSGTDGNPYIYPCIAGGTIVLISGAVIAITHPETHPKFTKLQYTHVTEDQIKKSKQYSFIEGIKIIVKDKSILLLLVIGALNSFTNGGLLLALVLFSSLDMKERGLGFSPTGAGIIFTVLGFTGFLFQVVFFKKMSQSIGLRKQYLLGMTLLCIGITLYPLSFMGYIMQGEAMVWVILMITVPIISIGFMQGLPIVQGMVANATNPDIQGLTQGSSQSLNSFLRAFGPAISGAIFSFSAIHSIPWLLFVFLGLIYIIIAIISLYLPESVDILRKKKGQQSNESSPSLQSSSSNDSNEEITSNSSDSDHKIKLKIIKS